MKIYKPTDVFSFGKYQGEKLDFVFTFHPEYIEWLILNSNFFTIDIISFKEQHTCPIAQDFGTEAKYYNSISLMVNGEPRICSLREYITEFTDLNEGHYVKPPETKHLHTFSDNIILKNSQKIELLKKKTQGNYEKRPQSYEGWLREEFGEDSGTANWNTH